MRMNKTELEKILTDHEKWLNGEGGRRADLSSSDLRDADLCNANLCKAIICNADLRDADLCNANLREANLHGADLHGADLHGADLSSAYLREANLRRANLSDADLSAAYLRGADLCEAVIDYSAWPLCCGSLKVKIDSRIAAQLVYHAVRACQSVTDDDGVMAFCRAPEVVALANRFHRVSECGLIGDKESEVNSER